MTEDNRSKVAARQVLQLLLEERQSDLPEVARPIITDGLIDAILEVGYVTQFDKERAEVQRDIRQIVIGAMRTGGTPV